MECKESSEGGVVYRETSSDSLDEGISYVGDGGKEISNDCSTSK